MADVTVKGGVMVTETGRQRADLGIRDGAIETARPDLADVGTTIDASGRRVMIGTDFPFDMSETDPVRLIDGVEGLTDDERSAIKSSNAIGAFGL